MGEFPFGSGWGRESWAGEVPYGGRASLSSFTSSSTGHPDTQRPWHRASTFNPEPSRPSPSFSRATLQGTSLCPASCSGEPLTLSCHLGLLPLPWRVCPVSDWEESLRDLLHLGSQSTRPWLYLRHHCHLTLLQVGAARRPIPSAWYDLCHSPGVGVGFTLSDPGLTEVTRDS